MINPFIPVAVADIEEQLRDYLLSGVAADILRAERAYFLAEAIGRHADRMNTASFGHVFGPLKEILSEHQTLAITKIFERPSHRCRVRTIPAVLRLLEAHADEWSIPQRFVLHELLVAEGHSPQMVSDWSGARVTQAIVHHFRTTLPSSEKVEECALSSSLELLRQSRDEAIAHHEAVSAGTRRYPTWGEATSLVEYAKRFVGVVGFGYVSFAFEAGGDYLLTCDAQTPSRALKRLLLAAGLSDAIPGSV